MSSRRVINVAPLWLAWSVIVVAGLISASGPVAAKTIKPICATAPAYGWLHTSGVWIEDEHSCHVRLMSVTWFGMETTNYVPDGLGIRTYWQIMREIKLLGFNSIRLTISDQMIIDNQTIKVKLKNVTKNPGLAGRHPLDVLDRLIYAAKSIHLMIILDNHGSRAANPRTSSIEATWTLYGEQTWINDWTELAARYKNDPTVIGFDLRNEPHTDGPGPWTLKTYLKQGATWGPYPNAQHPSKQWNPATGWAAAATKAGDAVLRVNPNLLMFVEGVQLYPDRAQPGGVFTYWWGSILSGVKVDPIKFSVPHRLVYSPHEWGPRRAPFFWFTYDTNYHFIASIMNQEWGFILTSPSPVIRNPIWIGEFDTCNYEWACVRDKHPGYQGQWWQIFIQYLHNNPEISWSYYPINGTNGVGKKSNNSILDKTWKEVRLHRLMNDLRSVMKPPPQQ